MANKVYVNPETTKVWAASGGDAALTFTSLNTGAGRCGASVDLGSTVHSPWYEYRLSVKAGAALALGVPLYLFMGTSDGSLPDGGLGASDAAISAITEFNNCVPLRPIIADSTTSGDVQTVSGIVEIRARYVFFGVFSVLGQALSGTAGDHTLHLTPVPNEIQ